ncbi:MAG TPA: iron-containing alcohol dehydrogenase [Kofleriaceae bacterium]
MNKDPIALLLAGQYPDPETGALLAADARDVVIADSLAGREVELLRGLGVGPHLAVVSDPNTHAALGARIERALASAFTVQSIVLPHPHADMSTVDALAAALAPNTDAIIAVGSGTLNDLTKMAGVARALPQLVFATAPSMNGYTSLSASIVTDGVKRSFRAATPIASYFDLAVIAAAPLPLIRAGLGDSVARATAQADWLLSHLLLGREYREAPFAMLAADESALFADPRALITGDLVAIRSLVRTLVLSGFGMTLSNGSYPASQGEHLLGHYLESIRPIEVLHGAQIGVCTIAMAELQARYLSASETPRVRASTITEAEILQRHGIAAGATNWAEVSPKLLTSARADELNAKLAAEWPMIRARIERIVIGPERTRSILHAAGCPATPADLGYTDDDLSQAVRHARELRDRYTFLDLAADAA